ncbi:MAG: preprotein translocase subunit SecY [Bacteroidales bacterium]|nr:preprotein translocase subunit SecY [Candidatus Scybalocola fimicaballi]
MKAIQTIKNIWKIEDLRNKILFTFLLILVYRFGSFIVLPGVNPEGLKPLENQTSEGLMSLLNMFSGGAFSNASIFALGIMPYISASIVVQLLTIALPYFQKIQKDGESGRKKITQLTRYLTVFILLIQGPSYLINLSMQAPAAVPTDFFFKFSSVVIMCAGSMFTMWLGERITDKGIGNGISIIILIGILARFPDAIAKELVSAISGTSGGFIILLLEFVFLFVVIMASIALVQAVRRIPVQYAKQTAAMATKSGSAANRFGGARQYIPLKVNAAGVMPIIFAQAIMFIPLSVLPFIASDETVQSVQNFMNLNSWQYNLVFAFLIIVFTYFYTAITIQPNQMAEDLKRNDGFIPKVKPGVDTAEYIDDVMSKITLPGAIFLAIIAIMPAIVSNLVEVNHQFAQFFGGTSLLIMVGVVLDTLQQIEGHLLMNHYDGLMENGPIRGRSGMMSTENAE